MNRFWRSAIVMFLAADAVMLLLFGRRWIRFTRFGHPAGSYYKLMTWFLQWPEAALRLAGAAEGALALTLFRRWEPQEQGAGWADR